MAQAQDFRLAWCERGKENMNNFKSLALSLSLVVSALSQAAVTSSAEESEPTSPVQQELQTEVPANPSDAPHFTGVLELRPSFTTNEYHTENLVELGYRFNPNLKLAFQQQFNTNIQDHAKPGQGVNPQLMAGFLRLTMSNLWKSGDWSLAYEPRLYIPENQSDFDSKRYLSMRNYVMLSKQVSSTYTITFMEIPIFHWYGARGTGDGASSPARANSYFENRFYIMNDLTFGKLTVSLPILWNMPRMLEYGGSPSFVKHNVWIWPEVAYAVDPNVQLGAALYTNSLVASDFSAPSVFGKDGGLSTGVLQFLLRATL